MTRDKITDVDKWRLEVEHRLVRVEILVWVVLALELGIRGAEFLRLLPVR
jgi:hypothetical protein